MTKKEWKKFEDNKVNYWQTIKYQFLWALGLVKMKEFRGVAVALGYPPIEPKEDILDYSYSRSRSLRSEFLGSANFGLKVGSQFSKASAA